MTIEPLHLSITAAGDDGRNLHLLENGDLGVRDNAWDIIRSAERGHLLLALGVDDDHDEVHYYGDAAVDLLRAGIDTLTLALAAAERVTS